MGAAIGAVSKALFPSMLGGSLNKMRSPQSGSGALSQVTPSLLGQQTGQVQNVPNQQLAKVPFLGQQFFNKPQSPFGPLPNQPRMPFGGTQPPPSTQINPLAQAVLRLFGR